MKLKKRKIKYAAIFFLCWFGLLAFLAKNVWHGLECLHPSVLLECKEGPFVEHEVDGILKIKK